MYRSSRRCKRWRISYNSQITKKYTDDLMEKKTEVRDKTFKLDQTKPKDECIFLLYNN